MSRIAKMLNEEILDPFLSLVNKCPVLNTPTDWKETPECHVFTADLPGLRKEEVKVEVVDDEGGKVLVISGNRKNDIEEGEKEKEKGGKSVNKWHRVERCRGEFRRRFRLPENAKTDEVKATMENGVLVVKIPKKEVKKPQKKVVEIK